MLPIDIDHTCIKVTLVGQAGRAVKYFGIKEYTICMHSAIHAKVLYIIWYRIIATSWRNNKGVLSNISHNFEV